MRLQDIVKKKSKNKKSKVSDKKTSNRNPLKTQKIEKTDFSPKVHRAWDYIDKAEHKPNTNQTQTKHKPNTNRTQIEHKPNTNRTQTKHKPNTNRTRIEHKPNTNRTQTKHKPNTNQTQIEHKPNTNQTQTEHESNTNRTRIEHKKNILNHLSPLHKEIVIFMYKNITQNSGVSTTPLSRVNIAQETKINQKSLCTSLKRLRDKEFLTYDDLKVGRNGWASYRMNKELMQDIKLFLEENS